MSSHTPFAPKSKAVQWFDSRLPIFGMAHEFLTFPTPRNLNYFWTFGGILTVMLVMQIVTGVILAMHYVPDTKLAFESVQAIRRDVNFGWLIQSLHMNGATMFFIAVYIHMFRGLFFGSYKQPREVLWILGVIILLLMMATAFMGYVLPYGQMSGWGATVITNFFTAIPVVGSDALVWLRGGYTIDQATLNRFFSLHFLMPFMIFGVVILHVWALHVVGNNNPTGVSVKTSKDTVPFHPYMTIKDSVALVGFAIFFAMFIFYMPEFFSEADNYIEFDALKTPAHIKPEWYFLPFYAILRAITFTFFGLPATLYGLIAMFGSIAILAFLPWLDTSKIRSTSYRPAYKLFFVLFVITCIILGYCGSQPTDKAVLQIGGNVVLDMTGLAQIFTAYYFAHFLVVLPLLGLFEKPLKLPASIADSVLSKGGYGMPIGAAAEPNTKG
jgi:ubiquinol-cytochrome c reductase cytochrome b/c1 subunit